MGAGSALVVPVDRGGVLAPGPRSTCRCWRSRGTRPTGRPAPETWAARQEPSSAWNNHTPRRKRKLLLHQHEIDKLERRVNERGLTIVPLSMYFKDGRAKVEIALAKGKNSYDKRHALATRDAQREATRELGREVKGF